MSYKVLSMADHKCDLPDPEDFPSGAQIQCLTEYLSGGQVKPCYRTWWRSEKFFGKRAYWSDDWGW